MTRSDQSRQHLLQWQIWDVQWEHEDGTRKARPALIISSNTFNAGSDEIWVVKISTKRHDVPHRMELADTDAAFKRTGLTQTSYFYLTNNRKIARSMFLRQRGTLGSFSALMLAIAIKDAVPQPFP